MWIARRGSRNIGPIDRWCRRLLGTVMKLDPQHDFMHDELIEQDVGFDADELDHYQRRK